MHLSKILTLVAEKYPVQEDSKTVFGQVTPEKYVFKKTPLSNGYLVVKRWQGLNMISVFKSNNTGLSLYKDYLEYSELLVIKSKQQLVAILSAL